MSVTTPNMNLIQPTVGVDTGLTWENAQNTNATTLDLHNHTPGYGVPITPLGLNINSDLTFNGNNAIALRSSRYQAQGSVFSASADIGCVYVVGVDLYYRDINGNNVQITSGGTVNATSSGISSGSATASFVSGVLVVNSAANTPANVQAGSILLGNNSPGSKFLTLSPPNSMPANYQVFLPSIPSQLSVLTLDTSGNITTTMSSTAADPVGSAMSSVGANSIGASMTSTGADAVGSSMDATGANAVSASRTRGTNTSVTGGVGISTLSSTTTSSQYPTYVSFGTVSVTTSGRPVVIGLTAGYPTGYILSPSTGGAGWYLLFNRNAGNISEFRMTNATVTSAQALPPGSYNYVDYGCPSGTNTYTIYMCVANSSYFCGMNNVIAYAYEL